MPRSIPSAYRKRTKRITITITEQVDNYLHGLVSLGLYGSTVAEAAVQLICEGLRNDLRRKRTNLLDPQPKSKL